MNFTVHNSVTTITCLQKQLGNHPHIIHYVASAGIPPSETSHGNAEFLIQTELCTGTSIYVLEL